MWWYYVNNAEMNLTLRTGFTDLELYHMMRRHIIFKTQHHHEDYIMAEHAAVPGNFAEDKEKASEAGQKAASIVRGTFKNDPQRAFRSGKRWPE